MGFLPYIDNLNMITLVQYMKNYNIYLVINIIIGNKELEVKYLAEYIE